MTTSLDRFNDYMERRKKRKEEGEDNSPSSSFAPSSSQRYLEYQVRRDYEGLGSSIDDAYAGWQDKNAMTLGKDRLSRAQSNLSELYDRYSGSYDDQRRSGYKNLLDAYNQTLSDWNTRSNVYAGFVNADAYNKAKRNYELEDKYKGKSYDEIQSARKGATGDERDFLDNYVNYSTKEDFEKAIIFAASSGGRGGSNSKKLDNLKSKYKNFRKENPFDQFKSIMESPDFEKYSTDDSNLRAFELGTASDPTRNFLRGQTPYASSLEGDPYKVATYFYNKGMESNDTDAMGVPNSYKDYLKKMAYPIRKSEREEMSAEFNKLASESPLKAAALSIGYNTAMGGIDGLTDIQARLQGINAPSTLGNISAAVNEANQNVSNRIGNEVNGVAKFGYDAITQYIPNRLRQKIFGNAKTLINAVMGLGAFSNTYNQKIYSGASNEESLRDAFIDGAFEFISEEVGGEWAFGGNAIAPSGFRSIAAQGGAEALEELFSGIGTGVLDIINNGQDSDVLRKYKQFITMGYGVPEAVQKTIATVGGDLLYEMSVAGFSATPDAAVNAIISNATGGNVDATKLAEAINSMNKDSETRQQFQSLIDEIGGVENLSKFSKGEAYRRAFSETADDVENLANKYEIAESKGNVEEADRIGDKYVDAVKPWQAVRESYIEKAEAPREQDLAPEDIETPEAYNVLADTKRKTDILGDVDYVRRQIKKEFDKAEQEIFTSNQPQDMDAERYKADFDRIYDYAHVRGRRDLNRLLSQMSDKALSDTQTIKIFNEIVAHDVETLKAAEKAREEFTSLFDGKIRKGQYINKIEGNLEYEEKIAKLFAETPTALGWDVEVYKDPNDTANGVTIEGGKIRINLAAREALGKSIDPKLVRNTVRHEMTHIISQTLDKSEWDEFTRPVKEFMGDRFDDAVAEYLSQWKKKHKDQASIPADVLLNAEEEVIARFFENINADQKAADKFFEAVNPKGLEKMKRIAKKAIDWIIDKVEKIFGKHETNFIKPFVNNLTDAMRTEFEDLFAEYITRASMVRQVQLQQKEEGQVKEESNSVSEKQSEQFIDQKMNIRDSNTVHIDDLYDNVPKEFRGALFDIDDKIDFREFDTVRSDIFELANNRRQKHKSMRFSDTIAVGNHTFLFENTSLTDFRVYEIASIDPVSRQRWEDIYDGTDRERFDNAVEIIRDHQRENSGNNVISENGRDNESNDRENNRGASDITRRSDGNLDAGKGVSYSEQLASAGYVEKSDKKLGFTNERIDKLLSGGYYGADNPNYAQAYITYMTPWQFLNLTTGYKNRALKRITDWNNNEWGEKDRPDFSMDKFAETYNQQPVRLTIDEETNEVIGHEGRHRMWQLKELGYEQVPVLVFNPDNKYDKHFLESIDLMPQYFGEVEDLLTDKDRVTLKNLLPFSQGNAEEIKRLYGEGNDADVHFSEQLPAEDSNGDELTPEQREFFDYSKAIDDDGSLMVTYHGSVKEFYTFDRRFAHMEGDWGKGFYFSNNLADVEENYANAYGPDLQSKLEREAERLLDWGGDEIVKEDGEYMNFDEIVEMLRGREVTTEPYYHECYLNIKNPCYPNTWLLTDVLSDVGDIDDYDDEDAYYEAYDEAIGDTIESVMEFIQDNFDNYDEIEYYEPKIREVLTNAMSEGGIRADQLKHALGEIYMDTDEGTPYKEITRLVIEALGYDGIIDDTVSKKFRGMHLAPDTVHYIVFNSNQAKLTSNKKPTNNLDTRLSEQLGEEVYSDIVDTFGDPKKLAKDVETLTADLERLRKLYKLQGKVTNGKQFKPNQLLSAAKMIRNVANAEISEDDLAERLNTLYNKLEDQISADFLGGEVDDPNYIIDLCRDLARDITENNRGQKVIFPEFKEAYDALRNTRIRLSEAEVEKMRELYGSNWHQQNFGRFKFVKDGISLREAFTQWRNKFPWAIDEIIDKKNPSSDEILESLGSLYDLVHDSIDMVSYFVDETDVQKVAETIYNKFWTISTLETVADKYDKEIKELKFEHRKAMDSLRESHEESMQKLRADKNEIIMKVRERGEQRLKDYKEKRKMLDQLRRENAEKKQYIDRITDTVETLGEWYKVNDKSKRIPDIYKKPLSDLINSIDFSSKTALGLKKPRKGYSAITQKDIAMGKLLKQITSVADKVGIDDGLAIGLSQQEIDRADEINQVLSEMQGNYVLQTMNVDDLHDLSTFMQIVKHWITEANEAFGSRQRKKIEDYVMPDYRNNELLGQKSDTFKDTKAFFEWKNATPIYASERLGKGMLGVFHEAMDGWDEYAFLTQDIEDFLIGNGKDGKPKGILIDTDYMKWRDDIKEFEFDGRKIQMPVSYIMNLYNMNKREQGRQHLYGINEEQRKAFEEEGAEIPENKLGGISILSFEGQDRDQHWDVVRLTPEQVDVILSTLDEPQYKQAKEIADQMMEYYKKTAKWINETSRRHKGVGLAYEDHYWNLDTVHVKRGRILEDEVQNSGTGSSLFALLNKSFTKAINPEANNAVKLGDIFDSFFEHTTDAAKYHALALPALDIYRYANYVGEDANGDLIKMRDSIEKAHGTDAYAYITKFLQDLNGTSEHGRDEKLAKILVKNYKAAQVAANIQTAALQPIAIIRADLKMGGNYLLRGVAMNNTQAQKEMLKYSGIALWKERGGYDINTQRGLYAKVFGNKMGRGKALDKALNIRDVVVEWALKPAGYMDKITWAAIWNGCKAEGMDHGLKSEELMQWTANRFREVVYYTQVVDSTMTRSEKMRDPTVFGQLTTSFLSEPTLTMNMLQDAVTRFSQDYRKIYNSSIKAGKSEEEAKKIALNQSFAKHGQYIGKCISIYIVSAAVESIVRGLFTKYRGNDEDDDKLYQTMWKEFMEQINPMQSLPIFRDVYNEFKGFKTQRTDMAAISNAATAYSNWKKILAGDKSVDYKTIYKTVQAVSQLTGIPVSSLMRDIKSGYDVISEMYPSLEVK